MNGTIYFVQPAELVGTKRYKIGCSSTNDLKRCKNGYKKGTRFIIIMECVEPFALELEIKKVFNSKFKLIAGKEYFEGDEQEMQNIFLEVIKVNLNQQAILVKPVVPPLPNVLSSFICEPPSTFTKSCQSCEICSYKTHKRSNLQRHLISKRHNDILNGSDNCAPMKESKAFSCKVCSKIYRSRVGLWNHKKKCYDKFKIEDAISTLLIENKEIKQMLNECFLSKSQ